MCRVPRKRHIVRGEEDVRISVVGVIKEHKDKFTDLAKETRETSDENQRYTLRCAVGSWKMHAFTLTRPWTRPLTRFTQIPERVKESAGIRDGRLGPHRVLKSSF
jgi:hypothetical protein